MTHRDFGALADAPLLLAYPDRLAADATAFTSEFAGHTCYAVKANPADWVLRTLYAAGVRHFDVASIAEAQLVSEHCPAAQIVFMHPVKSRRSIALAHCEFGCRVFAFDHADELTKIAEETGFDPDVTVVVRLSVSNDASLVPLNGKFGVDAAEGARLLNCARDLGLRTGATFHVGSQCLDPNAYRTAIQYVDRMAEQLSAPLALLDVGGGFPVAYDAPLPAEMSQYIVAIHAAVADSEHLTKIELWAEPGRALVARSADLVVNVDLRRDNALYINDGAFGALYDAAYLNWRFPFRMTRESTAPLAPFRLYGPTCESADVLEGPFLLPSDIGEGDRIQFSMMGAYGETMASRFNGFGEYRRMFVSAASDQIALDQTRAVA